MAPDMTHSRIAWHSLDPLEVEARLESSRAGLPSDRVTDLRGEFGRNEIEQEPPTGALTLLLRQFKSPLIYILLIAAVVTLALGEFVDTG